LLFDQVIFKRFLTGFFFVKKGTKRNMFLMLYTIFLAIYLISATLWIFKKQGQNNIVYPFLYIRNILYITSFYIMHKFQELDNSTNQLVNNQT